MPLPGIPVNARLQRASRWRLVRLCWYGLAACIVLTAVLLTALRFAGSLAPEYRVQLEARISDVLGERLALSDFRIEWQGLNPQLLLQDMEVGKRSGLAVRELRVDLDLGRSLWALAPVLSGLELVGMELKVRRDPAGRFHLVGVEAGWQQDSPLEAVDKLLNNLKRHHLDLRLTDSRVRLLDRDRKHSRLLDEVKLLLRELPAGGQQLAGHALLPEEWGREVAFVLEWGRDGTPSLREDEIDLFAEVHGLRPEAMKELTVQSDSQNGPVEVMGNLRIWGTLHGGLPVMGALESDGHHSGHFTVRAEDGELRMPRLFRGPIPFERFEAEANWRMDSQGWRLDMVEAIADNEDGRVMTRGTLARRPQQPLFIDLRAHLHGNAGNVSRTSRYLPAGIMRDKLITWLDNSIVDGTASRADMIFFGHLGDFPFADGSGRFEVRADITDASLDYLPGWPGLRKLNGRLHFLANSMHVTAAAGEIGGARLLNAEAAISQFGQTPLIINGNVQGPGQSMLGFLRDMPLTRGAVDRTVAAMRLDGDHFLSLALNIPFRGRPVEVKGQIELENARLRVPDWGLSVDSLNGTVRFDQQGVKASGVRGRFHGAPMALTAETRASSTGSQIRVRADARQVPLSALHHHLPGTEFLGGSGSLSVVADLPGFAGARPSEYPVELQFSSDLVGVGNTMPAPLGKDPGEDLPLSVRFGVGEHIGPVQIQYGERASLLLALADQGGGMERLGVHLGRGEVPLLPRHGIALSGKTARLDVDGWRSWSLDRERGASQDQSAISWHRLDVEAESLRLGGMDLPEVTVKGQREENWNLAVEGTTAAGFIQFPMDGGRGHPLRVNLRYLRLPSLPRFGSADNVGRSQAEPSSIPADVPSVEVDVGNLALMGRELGRLRIRGGPDEAGDYQLREVTLNGASYTLDITGRWRVPEGTNLWYSLRSEHVGQMLGAWGQPDMVQGGRGRSHGSLAWSGSPMGISAETLRGELNLSLRNGQLVKVEPGAGRLLGLISVAMLPRRLLLNFSDVVNDGFAFDRMEADFALAAGRATPRTLYMDGPAARISAEGDIDLVARTYDQTVTVIPKASATLPLIGGIIGGPPAAAALFVAQQLFSQGVDGAASVTYRLTGPWGRPAVERIGRSDDTVVPVREPGGGRSGQ